MTYQRHFLSAVWPDMSAEDHQALRDSIATSGLREPIVLLNGEVLDGWQRYTACLAEGVEPRFEEFEGEDGEEAADYVRDKHTRRSMTLTQRLVSVMQMSRYKPRGRPTASADPAGVTSPAGEIKSAIIADLSQLADRSAAEAAKLVGASTRSAESVSVALRRGAPEVIEGMRNGEVSANQAERIARLPPEEQPKAVEALKGPKPARFQGKPKKVPAAKLFAAEIKAVEAKKVAESAEEKVSSLEQEVAALREQLVEANEDNAALAKLLESSDQLAAALADAKAARDLARGLQQRINSMLTEIAELNRSVKHWQKKAGQPA